jgi:hypothetical protein
VKLLALAAVVLLAPDADVRFEPEGVRIGGALVQGAVVELQSAGALAMLASGSSFESLSSAVDVRLSASRSVRLEPGVRVARAGDAFRFSTHDGRKIRFASAGGAQLLESPVLVAATESGWDLGGLAVDGPSLLAGLQNQDDTDANLDRMKQSAQRVKQQGGVPKLSSRMFRRWHGSPLTGGEATDSVSVRQIHQISPTGTP